jgi:hypothetical protein
MKFKGVFFLFFAVMLSAVRSGAQEPEVRRYSFSGYLWSARILEAEGEGVPELYYFDGEEERRFPLRARAVTRRLEAVGDGNVVFFRREAVENPETGETEIRRVPVIRARVPERWDSVMFVFFREGGDSFRALPLRQDAGYLPEDHVVLVNSGAAPVVVVNGTNRFVVAAGGQQVFAPERGDTLMDHGYRLQLGKEGGNGRNIFYDRSHRLEPGGRQILLIHGGENRLETLTLDAGEAER